MDQQPTTSPTSPQNTTFEEEDRSPTTTPLKPSHREAFERLEKETLEFVREWLQGEKVEDVERSLEELFDSIFYSHSVRQAAFAKKQVQAHKQQSDKKGVPLSEAKQLDFTEEHLKFLILYLNRFQRLQHAFHQKFDETLSSVIQSLFCKESSTDERKFGVRIHMLCYEVLKNFAPSPEHILTPNKLAKFLQLYPSVFEIYKYTPHTQFISLKQSIDTPLLDEQVVFPTYIPLEQKVVLNASHLSLIRDVILVEHEKAQKEQYSRSHAAMPLSLLKKVLFEKHDILPKQILLFIQQRPESFDVINKKSKQNDQLYFLVRRKVTARKPKQQSKQNGEELPSFQIPQDYKIVCTSNSHTAAEWIQNSVIAKLNGANKVVVGMDLEWDLTRPLVAFQIDPHRAFQWKQQTQFVFRDHIHPPYMDTLQIAVEDSCLIFQTLQQTCDSELYSSLTAMMANEQVLKCLCSYASDVEKLKGWLQAYEHHDKSNEFNWSASLVELDRESKGAATLCVTDLHLEMKKDHNIQLSRWSRKVLDAKQQEYAAMDAYINHKLYFVQQALDDASANSGLETVINI